MITAQVGRETNGHRPCRWPPSHTCGAPLQHELALWIYQHPTARLKDAARELHRPYGSVKVVVRRLRKRSDYSVLCPFCFSPSRLNGACHSCGVELPYDSPVRQDFETQSPVHTILPGRGLGSSLTFAEYRKLARLSISSFEREVLTSSEVNALANNLAAVMKQQGNGKEDALVESIKSDVLQALKEPCPNDGVSDEAAMMVEEEVKSFRMRYQLERTPAGLRGSIARRVVARLEILHPELRGKLHLPERTLKPKRKVNRLTPFDPLDPRFDHPLDDEALLQDSEQE